MADIRQKQFTVDRIAHAMISDDMFDSGDNPFDENYYGHQPPRLKTSRLGFPETG